MQPSPVAVLAAVFLPFLGAAATPAAYRVLGERTAYFAAAVALACLGLVASQLGTHGSVVLPWIPAYDVALRFYVDGLATLIGLLASGVGVLIFAYSGGYMHGEPGRMKYYATLLAFMGSMLGIAFAADLLLLFVFWEFTSVCSVILIGHYTGSAAARYGARKSMFITVGGGLFMLVGFLLLYLGTGTFSIAELLAHPEQYHEALVEAGLLLPAVALIGVGAAAKSAQWPLHIWLPNAMEAPTPVSAFLHSATMVKAGVYLIGRLRPLLIGAEWTLLFAALGLVTMTVAAVLAVAATDIKELLAYSTASHLGLIVAGFGFASHLGAETGAFHILNHATFKAALFLVAGIVAHEAGTRRIEHLGGLYRDLPVTAAVTAVAALGMAGVPPFNGFYSKEFLFEAAYHAAAEAGGLAWLYPAVAVFGSVFTFLYSVRFLMLFFGEKPDGLSHVHRPPRSMQLPPVLLALLAGGIGLGGVLATVGVHLPIEGFVGSVVESVSAGGHGNGGGGGGGNGFSYYLPTHLSPAALMSAATIALGLAAYPAYGRLHRGINRGLAAVPPARANWWYDGAVNGLTRFSRTVVPRIQTGLLRTYAAWALAAACALALGGYGVADTALPALDSPNLTLPATLVLLVAVGAAAAITFADSHVAGVLTLSILGFMVAIFYILASAPDLALTQLTVETLTLVIFLLVLDRLPAWYGEPGRWRAVRDGALALAVGSTVTGTVLLTSARDRPSEGLQPAEVARLALEEGGGHNVVNVVLVDLRGFDTLGEISVVAMAAVSVVTLVAMRGRGRGEEGGEPE